MRTPGSSQNPRRAARWATTWARPFTSFAGRRMPVSQQPRPEMVTGVDQQAPLRAIPSPRRRTPASSPRAPLPRASTGTPVADGAGTGGRARFPYLPRAAAQNFKSDCVALRAAR